MKKTLLAVMAMVSLCSYAQLPVENFELPWVGNPAAPPGWTVVNEHGPNITWGQSAANPQSPPFGGSYAAYLGKENVSPTEAPPKDWLISPGFNVPVAGNFVVQFLSRLTINGDQGGIYKVLIGNDPANLSSFTELYSATELEINPVQTEYVHKMVSIPQLYAGVFVYIAFVMEGDDADRWLIDDVGIFQACNAPTALTVSNLTSTSADLNWNQEGGVTSWEVEVISANTASTGIGTIYNGTLPYTVTQTTAGVPLAPGTYKYYVRSVCQDGGVSNWTGPVIFSTDAAFNNELHGIIRYDANDDDICDANDTPVANVPVSIIIDGTNASTVYTNQLGEYTLYGLGDGVHEITITPLPIPGFMDFQTITYTVTFDEEVNEWNISHCVPHPEPFNNLSLYFGPNSNAVPGFDAYYVFLVQNLGTATVNDATVTVEFDTSKIDYVSTDSPFAVTISGNVLTINVEDIEPGNYKSGALRFHVKEPPVNTISEQLHFTAALSDVADDIDLSNNTRFLNQIITGSYDPNDITVHEGDKITISQAGDYLTYTIRFQNTGNGNAVNIKLENTLDELLDWATFEPIASSHPNSIKRTDDQLEFYFENIQLPYESADEPGSHGYVSYRIKPKAEFGVGDIISNTAEIYFDFNPAIVTNTATTEVVALAGLSENALAVAKLYPNPVKDQLHVAVQQGELQSVTIYDLNGRLCLSANAEIISTNALTSGIYFVKVTTNSGSANYKIIKH